MNTWGVLFDGYKAPIVREVAGSVKEKADFNVGQSRRYKKKISKHLAAKAKKINRLIGAAQCMK